MTIYRRFARAIAAALALAAVASANALAGAPVEKDKSKFYLPGPGQAEIVEVSEKGNADAEITVLTEAVAIKETGPKETVAKFGEVYEFSPELLAVRRDHPTRITFWNLQPDDEHDFMLADPDFNVLMHVKLAPLSKTSYVFTFHRKGIFTFYCAVHQPEMNGQILVLPKRDW